MLKSIIANNLKTARAKRGWSLSRASEITSVSKAMLGQIEREESSPTMAVLWKIAQGFALPISALVERHTADHMLGALRTSEEIALDDNIQFHTLFSYDPELNSEMFAMSIKPGKKHQSNAHTQGVIEDIVVISGTLDLYLQDNHTQYKAGQSVRFSADQAHGYGNSTKEVVHFHNIIHYPKLIAAL